MFFAGWRDSHDKRIEKLLENAYDSDGERRSTLQRDDWLQPKLTNYNLVGIRRRLNNIEVGVWVAAIALVAHVWRHW